MHYQNRPVESDQGLHFLLTNVIQLDISFSDREQFENCVQDRRLPAVTGDEKSGTFARNQRALIAIRSHLEIE